MWTDLAAGSLLGQHIRVVVAMVLGVSLDPLPLYRVSFSELVQDVLGCTDYLPVGFRGPPASDGVGRVFGVVADADDRRVKRVVEDI